jgi:hypothetical protein
MLCCAVLRCEQELSDIRELTSCLADDSAIELWGLISGLTKCRHVVLLCCHVVLCCAAL